MAAVIVIVIVVVVVAGVAAIVRHGVAWFAMRVGGMIVAAC
jgi:hypothetical protein